jgi:hypothetical protein
MEVNLQTSGRIIPCFQEFNIQSSPEGISLKEVVNQINQQVPDRILLDPKFNKTTIEVNITKKCNVFELLQEITQKVKTERLRIEVYNSLKSKNGFLYVISRE